MKKAQYTQFLSDQDKLDIFFIQNRGKVSYFSVNYSALINSRWRTIMRMDNCHGLSHRHTYHLQRKQFRIILNTDNNTAFTESKSYIIKNFVRIRENYIKVRRKYKI